MTVSPANPSWVTVIRIATTLLFAFYMMDTMIAGIGSSAFGGPWQYLTIWALTVNMAVAASLLWQSFRPGQMHWHSLLTVATGLNFYVLLAYWGLWFMDRSLVQGDAMIPLYRQSFLHVGMILICWFEGFGLHKIWQNPRRVIGIWLGFFVGYMLWIELLLKPINGAFPYPFLDAMSLPQRLGFHGASMMAAGLFMGLAFIISRRTNRFAPGWPG